CPTAARVAATNLWTFRRRPSAGEYCFSAEERRAVMVPGAAHWVPNPRCGVLRFLYGFCTECRHDRRFVLPRRPRIAWPKLGDDSETQKIGLQRRAEFHEQRRSG